MVPLPSHSLKQWGQLGEILGGVKFPERSANCGPVLPPKPGGVVSNTGKKMTLQESQDFRNGGAALAAEPVLFA